ncbi:hypothetical protein MKX34_26450 [Paenibacillus sp. FSL R5-0636]|uniref:hypothetical protein n=1 Tax=Paenibacillus TaxID=44249 RepID=UPI00096D633F|nr:hypothetical protein [Paenibacillus odorifer]OMC99131.1 hypothetical protein BJP49_29840 [Paenibacillus odorifer]
MKIQIAAHFNKQTKDSKKELVQFHVKGDDEKKPELNAMTRSVVVLSIDGVEQSLTTEFSKSTKDAKKTVLEFIVKGDTSSENSYEFYRKAGSDVVLEIAESQMSIEEFRGDDDEEDREEPREGVRGKVNPDGTIELEDKDQLTIEQLAEAEVGADDGPKIPESDDDLPF